MGALIESISGKLFHFSKISKINRTATVDPAVTNDNTQGYTANSEWLNTVSGNWFIAISVATGSAIWKRTTIVNENGILVVTGGISFGASVTTNISANTNNLTPAGYDSATVIRANCTVASNVTGLIAPTPIATKEVYFFNVGTANLTLKNNDVLSTAGNRFFFATDILLQPNEGLVLIYDDITLRYRSAAKNT